MDTEEMDAGILQALKTVKNNPYVQYVGLGLAALIAQKDRQDSTGAPLRKTKLELIRISAAVSGIELCYAAETAFVSPILLKLGVPTSLMTLTWCLSPFLGFFLVPVMGSLSDRCQSKFGRRRPFIVFMSVGIILGLALVPNGEALGLLLGDSINDTISSLNSVAPPTELNQTEIFMNSTTTAPFSLPTGHVRGIIFTILGVAMLDFNCDACQSPCRAYLLDVSVPDDHPTGLTTFTVMAGAGGSIGYIMGGIDWNSTNFGEALGGHIRVVFSIVLFAFIICVISTLTSFKEIPLSEMNLTPDLQASKVKVGKSKYRQFTNEDSSPDDSEINKAAILEKDVKSSYGTLSGKQNASSVSANGAEFNRQGGFRALSDAHCCRQKDPTVVNEGGFENGKPNQKQGVQEFIFPTSVNQNYPTTNGQDNKLFNSFSQHQSNNIPTAALTSCIPHSLNTHEGPNGGYSNLLVQSDKHDSANYPHEPSKLSHKDSSKFRNVFSPGANQNKDEINLHAKYSASQANSSTQTMDIAVRKVEVSTDVTLKTYLRSIVRMPRSMWTLCLCNLLCWMSLVCYSLYFTDFVGQSVFGGNPQAPAGSDLHKRYDAGVRLGSLGMSLYSLSCACYSLTIERLVQRFMGSPVIIIFTSCVLSFLGSLTASQVTYLDL
ncbi:unnamed protein product [Candidula unifasciata]|uniref:Uncharacterized protein n=1 Tax=Candidula unifasciata TaxID=100452 RepID=A0A8S3Z368_9EUPU|nr:unnamed protein product [Candidula unifasciata]